MSVALLVGAGLVWLGLLFGAALLGERRPQLLQRHWGLIYSLSLAVYCTSWTFYGTVTQAARSGWWLPPTFVGTILLYVFGIGLLMKLVKLAQAHRATSLADFIATRLGKSSSLAAVITLIAVLGVLPYIALQLKAVAMSYSLLTRAADLSPPPWQDVALYVALAMALFAMLFGTRRASAIEHNRGLVLAMAFESLLKLGAMLALGVFVAGAAADAPALTPRPGGAEGFPALILLGVLAMFTLPHQFHVGVVECRDERLLRTARWVFPLYMVLIALPLLPLARAGLARLEPLGVPSDLYVLALPLSQGQGGLALLAFLGGLSAATGMVILATLSLSLMIGNHWLAPLRVRGAWAQPGGPNRRGEVLLQRRAGILATVLLAWAYSRAIVGNEALADIGAVSFSALATIAPALGFAMWRPRTSPQAVLIGLALGVTAWAWMLLVPALGPMLPLPQDWLDAGPFGLAFLAPDNFLGLSGWSRMLRAVLGSLVIATLSTWLVDVFWRRAPRAGDARPIPLPALRDLAGRFLPPARIDSLFALGEGDAFASAALQLSIERELAAVLGAASARLLMDTARTERGSELETVATIVGDAAQASRFNQQLLEAALENMSQGISVVDRELRLVAWNRRYAEMFGFPADFLQVGQPVQALVHWALAHGFGGEQAEQNAVDRRLAHMRSGTPHLTERRFPDGSMVEIRGNPMPGGGFVATYTDVTAFRRAETELTRANETLEQRVADRTRELDTARRAAESANAAKSRFLAAISHDLLQPLHAAKLFAHALDERITQETYRPLVGSLRGALGSTESLLGGILDISRLDAGRQPIDLRDFPLAELLGPMADEFRVMAAERGIELELASSDAWTRSDPQLLRRILMNFLANAVRYTERGRVLIGVRRAGGDLRIEVWDTGPGIDERDQRAIFDEFRRGEGARGQGLGLGLAIAERTARLLGHALRLRSWPGKGSMFSVTVPQVFSRRAETLGQPAPGISPPADPEGGAGGIALVLDNDASVRHAMRALLEGWGWRVLAAAGIEEARGLLAAQRVDVLLLDYHLDLGQTGLDAWRAFGLKVPAVIITADRDEAIRSRVEADGLLLLHKPLRPLALRSLLRKIEAGVAAG